MAGFVLGLFTARMCPPAGRVKMLAAKDAAPHLRITAMKMNQRYWTSLLREAERELEAATRRAALNAAGRKLMEAKVKLKQLQAKGPPVEA
jgi:hypothetical protein